MIRLDAPPTIEEMDRFVSDRPIWQVLASQISAPPRKVVVAMIPPPEKDIQIGRFNPTRMAEEGHEANMFAQFAMPKVKAFFEHPRCRTWTPQERQAYMQALLQELAKDFHEIYHAKTKSKTRAVRITDEHLGVVVASPGPDYPAPGSIVACHPEDGTRIDAFGMEIAVFGAFLPEMEWKPRYCDWWESIPVEVANGMLRAYGNKIVIQLDAMPEKVGVILLSDNAKQWNAEATVLSVGREQSDVHPGERWSVDMNLVTTAGLDFALGPEYERQFVIPPEALNFRYEQVTS